MAGRACAGLAYVGVAAALVACAERPAPSPAITELTLAGQRGMVETSSGTYIHELDREAMPRLRFRGPAPAQAWLVVSGVRAEVPLIDPEPRGDRTLVRTASPARTLPFGTGRLELGGASVPVVWSPPPSSVKALAEARRHRSSGAFDEAEAAYRSALDGLPPAERATALGELAGTLGQRGDVAGVVETYAAAAEVALAAGRPSAATRHWRAAAYTHYFRRRFSEVEPFLARAEALDRRIGNDAGLAKAAYYRGLTLQARGQLQRALAAFEEGLERARDGGLDDIIAPLTRAEGSLLQDMGLHARALATLDAALPYYATAAPHERAVYLVDRGWILARAMEAGAIQVDWAAPKAAFREALEALRTQPDPLQHANVLANLLWIARISGTPDEVASIVSELEALERVGAGYADLFVRAVKADLALDRGALADAQAAYLDLRTRADAEALGAPSEHRARAQAGLAEVARARGKVEPALARYAEAIDEIEQLSQLTDLEAARAQYWLDREEVLERAITLAVERGRVDRAFHWAERTRTLVLRALEQPLRVSRLSAEARAEWEQLRARYGELRAAFEKSRQDDELVPASKRAAREAERVAQRAELASAFASAFHHLEHEAPELVPSGAQLDEVARALGPRELLWSERTIAGRRLRFTITREKRGWAWVEGTAAPPAELSSVDHVYVVGARSPMAVLDLMVDGQPILARVSVSFLPQASLLARPPGQPTGGPVIVADPDGTLPHARLEGHEVARLLPGARTLIGDRADRASVLGALDGASLFHFSGHAGLHPTSPWDGYLALAHGERLTLEDLLITRPRIALVILDGCETGVSAELTPHDTIGLPEAFLVSGADAVVATSSVVGDEAARRFVGRLYRGGVTSDPVGAYRRAANEARAEGDAAWRSFYVLGRRR